MKIVELNVTTDASGDYANATESDLVNGYIEKIVYDYQDAATGADIVITNKENDVAQPVITVTNAGTANVTWYPRVIPNKVADASAFTDVAEKILVTGSFGITVAQGGNAKDLRLLIYLSEVE